MSDTVKYYYNGHGFLTFLGLIFITLKLTGHITWSWFWVLAPLWIPLVIFLGVLAVFLFVVLVLVIFGKR